VTAGAASVAATAPHRLLLLPAFWLRQSAFLAAAGGAVAAVVLLSPFTYGAARGVDVVLLLVVHALGVWGGWIAMRALAAIEVEHAIVREIERKGTELLREVRTGQRSRIDLEQLEQAIVPNNPTDPPPAMIRLFQHICKEAKDRRFESSVHVMQPYREEPLEDLFRLQNLQKIALWLGILGTFIGLLTAVTAVDVNAGDFQSLVQRMFGGLRVAFSASLAGLEIAVFIGVLLLLLRRAQERYFKVMEAAVVTMLSLARNSLNRDEFMAEFAQVSSMMQELTERVRTQTAEHVRGSESTRREIAEQTASIRDGIEKLAQTRTTFDGFLNGLSSAQAQFIDEVRGVYDTISLKELSSTLHGSLMQAGRVMADAVSLSTRQIATRLTDFNSAVDQLTNTLDAQAQESAQHAKTLAAQIAATTNDSTNALRAMTMRLQEMASREQTIRGDLQELSRTVAMLTNAIHRLDHGSDSGARSIRRFIASLRW
jgi:methyl-accepting chemotaxis protein